MLPVELPPIDWPRPLLKRLGGITLLDGIEIWHDFDWCEVLGHDRGVFPNCKSIGRKIRVLTPVGAVPVLLLTQDDDGPPYRVVQVPDGRVIHILDIQSVLTVAADAADTIIGHSAVPDRNRDDPVISSSGSGLPCGFDDRPTVRGRFYPEGSHG